MTAKISKYLTDMKELPPVTEESDVTSEKEADKTLESHVPETSTVEEMQKPESAGYKKEKDLKDREETAKIESKKSSDVAYDEFDSIREDKVKVFSGKDIVLAVINGVCIFVLIFILIKFPGKSQDLKNERNQMLLNDAGFNFELSEISQAKAKADEMNKVFVDESGIVDFVNDLEMIKAKSGNIRKINFTSQKAVEDRQTSNPGIPVVIEFTGDMDKVLNDIDEIQKLPFILRPITIEIGKNEDDPNVLDFKYGGFLYVNDTLR